MVIAPILSEIQKHVDHYWILNDTTALRSHHPVMYAYPGITPDMIIILEGYYTMTYMGKTYTSNESMLFSFIHERVLLDLSGLKRCIIIKFKSRGLSSLVPFVSKSTQTLMRYSVAKMTDVFGPTFNQFKAHIAQMSPTLIAQELDGWLFDRYTKNAEGFVVAMAQEISQSYDIRTIMDVTGYSYSTIERHFKRDTGLTPKRFQSLQRYKLVLRELFVTGNNDWQHYVNTYGYYDQSHFIKEIKRYTQYTPEQLLKTHSFIGIRPAYI